MEIDKLINDDEFKEAVIKADTIEKLGTLLRTYGIEAEDKDLISIFDRTAEGELDESALEDVAGGSVLSALRNLIGTIHLKANHKGTSGSHAF